jgi:hypothetical protein
VGVVHQGRLIDVATAEGEYVRAELPNANLETASDAVLLVSASAVASCEPRPR